MSTPTIWYYGDQTITGNYTQNQSLTLSGQTPIFLTYANVTTASATSNVGSAGTPWSVLYSKGANVTVMNVTSVGQLYVNLVGPIPGLWAELGFNSSTPVDLAGLGNWRPPGSWSGSLISSGGPGNGPYIRYTNPNVQGPILQNFAFYNFASTGISISVWIRYEAASTDMTVAELDFRDGALAFNLFSQKFVFAGITGASAAVNTWYNLVGVVTPSRIAYFYINGVFQGAGSYSGGLLNLGGILLVNGSTVTNYTDMRLYSSVLGLGDVSAIYAGLAVPSSPPIGGPARPA